MTTHLRTVTTAVLVTAVLGITLAGGLYTFRAQLADAPVVSSVLARLGWQATMTDDALMAGMDMDRADAASVLTQRFAK